MNSTFLPGKSGKGVSRHEHTNGDSDVIDTAVITVLANGRAMLWF